MAWSGLGFHLTWFQGSPLGDGWYPTGRAGEWGLMLEPSLCQWAACAGWFSWAAAQVGLLATTKRKGPFSKLAFGVLRRLDSACQEGKGAIQPFCSLALV